MIEATEKQPKEEQNPLVFQPKVEDLQFISWKFADVIPRKLIEDVKQRAFSPEEFYSYQKKMEGNPYNHLFVLVDEEHKIHGFLWAEQNMLDKSLFVNTFSISKEYWGKGKAIAHVGEFLKKLKMKLKAPKIFWCTTNERFFVKHGFVRSKISLMEYN